MYFYSTTKLWSTAGFVTGCMSTVLLWQVVLIDVVPGGEFGPPSYGWRYQV